jgi:adenylate cyclase class 2
MSTEIEIKAWVDDPGALRARLAALCGGSPGQGTAFTKEDAYWASPVQGGTAPPQELRIRRETKTSPGGTVSRALWVTYKVKEVRDGMEINDEREFSVSDGPAFEELLCRLGLTKGIEKRKQGWSWNREGNTVELSEVEGLGWFVELEILTAGDAGDLSVARTRLLSLLREIKVPEDRIEARYYTEMLRESPGQA